MKRFLSIIVAMLVFAASILLTACGGLNQSDNKLENVVYFVRKDDAMFSLADKTAADPSSFDAMITLNGSSAVVSDTAKCSGGERVEIKTKGVYKVSGSSENVSIVVDDENKSGDVYLLLDNVSMTNSIGACISVKSADKLIICLFGENSLIYSSASSLNDPILGSKIDSAIYSKDDLTINGADGSKLSVESTIKGIVVKDDLKIFGSSVTINSKGVGIDVNDSLRVGGGNLFVTSQNKEGVVVKNSLGDSFYYMDGGNVNIVSELDGLSVKGGASKIVLAGGAIDITSGGGASGSKNSSVSQKGLECDGDIMIGNANVTVTSLDDGIHCNSSVSLTDGKVEIASADDGVSADKVVSISGGNVTVSGSYEGIEAKIVSISGGNLSVTSTDDGINAVSGDTETLIGKIHVFGGDVYVNSGGDGLDSTGSVFVSGGRIVVEAGKRAFNKGENGSVISITGGTVLGIGAAMINFDSGAQCSAALAVSGDSGAKIEVSDGSILPFETSKPFGFIVCSSPTMKVGRSYKATIGEKEFAFDFKTSYYFSKAE